MSYGYTNGMMGQASGGGALSNAAANNKAKLLQLQQQGKANLAQQQAMAGTQEAAVGSTLGTIIGSAFGGPVGGAIGGALGGAAGKAVGGGQVNPKEVVGKTALGVLATDEGQGVLKDAIGDMTGRATDAQINDILSTESTIGQVDNTDTFSMIDELGTNYLYGGGKAKRCATGCKVSPLSVASVEYKRTGGKVGESCKICYNSPLGDSSKK